MRDGGPATRGGCVRRGPAPPLTIDSSTSSQEGPPLRRAVRLQLAPLSGPVQASASDPPRSSAPPSSPPPASHRCPGSGRHAPLFIALRPDSRGSHTNSTALSSSISTGIFPEFHWCDIAGLNSSGGADGAWEEREEARERERGKRRRETTRRPIEIQCSLKTQLGYDGEAGYALYWEREDGKRGAGRRELSGESPKATDEGGAQSVWV